MRLSLLGFVSWGLFPGIGEDLVDACLADVMLLLRASLRMPATPTALLVEGNDPYPGVARPLPSRCAVEWRAKLKLG